MHVPYDCDLCGLSTSRTNVVYHRGNYTQKVIVVGEAPGHTEDECALSFTGDSGKMLEIAFNSVGLSTFDMHVTNLCRCKPPENRPPLKKEQNLCYPYLLDEIRVLKPKIILTLGNTPTKFLLCDNDAAISKVRGKIFEIQLPIIDGRKKTYTEESYLLLPTYHPSALLRTDSLEPGSFKFYVWQDMILLKKILDGTEPEIYKKLP